MTDPSGFDIIKATGYVEDPVIGKLKTVSIVITDSKLIRSIKTSSLKGLSFQKDLKDLYVPKHSKGIAND